MTVFPTSSDILITQAAIGKPCKGCTGRSFVVKFKSERLILVASTVVLALGACTAFVNQRSEAVDKILNVAQSDAINGDNGNADKHFQQAISEAEKIEGNQFPLVDALNKYGSFKKQCGQKIPSKAIFQRALTICKQFVDADSTHDISHNESAKNWMRQARTANLGLAECFADDGSYRVAERYFKETIKLEERLESVSKADDRGASAGTTESLRSTKTLLQDMLDRERHERTLLETAIGADNVGSSIRGKNPRAEFVGRIKKALDEPDLFKREKLIAALADEALKKYGPREVEYRLALGKLWLTQCQNAQWQKSVAMLDADLELYPVSLEKLDDDDTLTLIENVEFFVEDTSMILLSLRELKRYDEVLKRGQQAQLVVQRSRVSCPVPMSTVLLEMSRTNSELKQYKEAQRLLEESLKLVPPIEFMAERRVELLKELQRCYRDLNNWAKVRTTSEEGLQVISQYQLKSPHELEFLAALDVAFVRLGETVLADSVYHRTLDQYKLKGDFGSARVFYERVASMRREAGDKAGGYDTMKDLEEFVACSTEPQREVLLAEILKTKCAWLEADGRRDEAVQAIIRSAELATKYDASPIMAAARLNEAEAVCNRAGRFDLSEKLGRKAVSLCEKGSDNDGPLVSTLLQLSYPLTQLKKYGEQRKVAERALSIVQSSKNKNIHPSHRPSCYVRLANAELMLASKGGAVKDPSKLDKALKDQASAHQKTAIEMLSTSEFQNDPDLRPSIAEIAFNYSILGEYEESLRYFERFAKEYPEQQDPFTLEQLEAYADVLKKLHRNDEEQSMRKRIASMKRVLERALAVH